MVRVFSIYINENHLIESNHSYLSNLKRTILYAKIPLIRKTYCYDDCQYASELWIPILFGLQTVIVK